MVTVTHGALSSNNLVNGVLWDGWKWQDGGAPLNITYFFAEDGGVSWTQSAKAAFTTALGTYSQVANITFSETTVRADANFVESLVTHAQQLDAVGSHGTPEYAASAGTRILDGTHSSSLAINQAGGYYTLDYSSWGGPSDWTVNPVRPGGYVADIMIHELGHALGLKHPHDIIGSAPTFPGVSDGQFLDPGSNDLNHRVFSVMSYVQSYHFDVDGRLVFDQTNNVVNGQLDYGYASTPMAFDIAAIQYLYGANTAYHTGNDVYLLPEADVIGAISTNWSSIWDAGGSDTLEYDGSANTILDLRAATLDDSPTGGGILSYAAFVHGGFTIANGVVIERAVGGSGNDSITGNSADNTFRGRGGDDTIEGGAGTDTAIVAGLRSSYTVTGAGNAQLLVVGLDGTDTLTNVERLQFDDSLVTYEISVNGLDGDSVTFTEGGGAVHLDTGTAATVTDSDPADFNVSKLTVSITANKAAGEDLLGIDTSAATTVTLSAGLTAGSTVSVGATAIGTIAVNGDGANGHDLIVTFNANATPATVGMLLDALTYSDSNQADPSTLPRTVAVTLEDEDGATSMAADVTVDVVAVNDAPGVIGAVALAAIAESSGARLITQAELLDNATDPDGPPLTATGLTIVTGAGTLVDNHNGTWNYTPALNDDTAVSFSYQVTDGVAAPVAGSATLDITPVNDAPVVAGVVTLVAIAEDSGARLITQAQLLGNVTDVDGPPLTATGLAIAAGSGSLVNNNNGTWSYTPALNDDTSVSFSYQVTDGIAAPVANSAALDITPVNDVPIVGGAVTLSAIAEESGPRLITQAQLLGNVTDVDGPSLTATGLAIATGAGALVNNNNGTWSYTPALNDDTSVSFSYQVTDGIAAPVTGSATLDITPVNDAPVVTGTATLSVIAEDSGIRLITQAQLLGNVTDVDGPSLTAANLAIATGAGTLLDNNNGTWSYTPALNDDTSVSFAYHVTDGTISVADSATLEITPVNDAPIVTGAVTLAAIAEDSGARLITQAQLLGNVTDVDGPSLTATAFAIATGSGSLVNNNNGTWSYTPAHNDDTAASFSWLVTDGTNSVADSATLDITPVNDAPVNTMPASRFIVPNADVAVTGLAVGDVDSTSLTTTLHVEHGTLNVGAVGGATVVGSGSSTVTLTGSAAQIDAVLGGANNVLYHSVFNFSGIEHLTMTSSDGALGDTDVLNLSVFEQVQAQTFGGITRPTLTLDSTGHIILDQAAAEFAAAYGTKALYLGMPESTPYPPVAAHDFHLV